MFRTASPPSPCSARPRTPPDGTRMLPELPSNHIPNVRSRRGSLTLHSSGNAMMQELSCSGGVPTAEDSVGDEDIAATRKAASSACQ